MFSRSKTEQLGAIRALECIQTSSSQPTRELWFYPVFSTEKALSCVMEKAGSSALALRHMNYGLRLSAAPAGPWKVALYTAPTPGWAGPRQDGKRPF